MPETLVAFLDERPLEAPGSLNPEVELEAELEADTERPRKRRKVTRNNGAEMPLSPVHLGRYLTLAKVDFSLVR